VDRYLLNGMGLLLCNAITGEKPTKSVPSTTSQDERSAQASRAGLNNNHFIHILENLSFFSTLFSSWHVFERGRGTPMGTSLVGKKRSLKARRYDAGK